MSELPPVITIDGPSGSGKGTVCQLLAKELEWHLLDSGALYRVLAYAAEKRGIDMQNHDALAVLAAHLDVQFEVNDMGGFRRVIWEGENITDLIRTEVMGNMASKIGAVQCVRAALVDRQRAFRELPGLIADGRDMGTTIFPDAKLKIFLMASPEERAKRRYKQLLEKGVNVKLAALIEEIAERDQRDQNRKDSPLRAAEDAVLIDTTTLSIEEVMTRVRAELKRCL